MMLFRYKVFIPIVLLCFISGSGNAQEESFLDDFQVSRINTHIFLTWQLRFGNTCNGITIHRSPDSIHFTRIGLIPGICGSPTEAARFHFIDSEPELNRRNYYQLEFGGVGVSEIIGIDFLDFRQQDYQIWPHPAFNDTKIFFQNEEGRSFELILYAPDGKIFSAQTTTSDYFMVQVSDWTSGMYIFTIRKEDESSLITGKLFVHH